MIKAGQVWLGDNGERCVVLESASERSLGVTVRRKSGTVHTFPAQWFFNGTLRLTAMQVGQVWEDPWDNRRFTVLGEAQDDWEIRTMDDGWVTWLSKTSHLFTRCTLVTDTPPTGRSLAINWSPPCDCGALKCKTTHAAWCSTTRARPTSY